MLIIFDVEGVLYDAEYLPMLARLVNKEDEILKITLKGLKGEIPWEEGLKLRINALKRIKYEDALKVAMQMKLMKGAKEACKTLKDAGWKLIAVSGGFDLATNKLKDELNLDYVFCNELVFNDGYLHGVNMKVTSDKAASVIPLIKELNVKKENIVAVIDGANDLTLFNIAGLKIAFNAFDIVKRKADVVIDEKDLRLIIPAIEKHYGTIKLKF